MTITIYHHPRCSKSRKTLELLESRGIRPNIVDYVATPPAPETLLEIAALVGVPLQDLLRTGETDFTEASPAAPVEDTQALAAWLHEHPRVLQRPIVVDEDQRRAIVGRPPENVFELIPE